MLASFVILFREVLEISVILSVIYAATRGVAGRNRWVMLGVTGGILGSTVVAFFARTISSAFEGMGQEIFNAVILGIAVVMIAWTVIWMQSHGRELAQKIKHVGRSVRDGDLPLYSVAIIVSLAMWREGAEIVLFMTGILSTSQESMLAIIAGGTAGLICAATIGVLLYFGLITMSSKHLFKVSSALLILLACGMSAQAAGYLVDADILPAIIPQLWDSSALLSDNSIIGKILGAMIGYTDQPSAIQAMFYVVTLAAIYGFAVYVRKNGSTKAAAA